MIEQLLLCITKAIVACALRLDPSHAEQVSKSQDDELFFYRGTHTLYRHVERSVSAVETSRRNAPHEASPVGEAVNGVKPLTEDDNSNNSCILVG